jgi:hypothetical protein
VPVRAAAGLTVDQERDRHWADSARFGDWSKYESAVGTFLTSALAYVCFAPETVIPG